MFNTGFEIVGHVWDVNGQMVNTGFRFVGKAGSKSVGHECSIQVLKSWVVNGQIGSKIVGHESSIIVGHECLYIKD